VDLAIDSVAWAITAMITGVTPSSTDRKSGVRP
jgi:hypothetical protein